MTRLFENLQEFIPDLANEHLEEDLVEAVSCLSNNKRKKPVCSLIWEYFRFYYSSQRLVATFLLLLQMKSYRVSITEQTTVKCYPFVNCACNGITDRVDLVKAIGLNTREGEKSNE